MAFSCSLFPHEKLPTIHHYFNVAFVRVAFSISSLLVLCCLLLYSGKTRCAGMDHRLLEQLSFHSSTGEEDGLGCMYSRSTNLILSVFSLMSS